MKQIIEKLKEQIANSIEYGNDLDAASWGMQEGVLITANEAQQIVEALEGMEKIKASIQKEREFQDKVNDYNLAKIEAMAKQLRSANRELAQKRVDGFKAKQEKMLKDLSAKELEDDVNRNKI